MNDKEIVKLQNLQREADMLEERAMIKEKERELKSRIKEAKQSIKGPSFLDFFMGSNKEKKSGSYVRYNEIFNEPLRKKPIPIPMPQKKAPIKKQVTKKAPKEEFIIPEPIDINKRLRDLDKDLDFDNMEGLI